MPTIRTNDVETYYERRGEGRPIVFVHGAWIDRRLWRHQVESFGDDYETITYDLRGHGRTGPSSDPGYTIELFAADLKAFVDAIDLDRPVICGLSLGGMVAQTYAVRNGRNLGALILADTAASAGVRRRDKLLRLLFPGWAVRAAVGLLGPDRYVDVADWLAERTRNPDSFGRDETVRSYVRDSMASFDAAEFNKVLRAIYEFRGVDLSSVGVPTLVLNGEHESRSVFEHAAHMERTIPDARSTVVPDAGHVSNMENPAAFDREVADFLADALD